MGLVFIIHQKLCIVGDVGFLILVACFAQRSHREAPSPSDSRPRRDASLPSEAFLIDTYS